MIRSIAPAGLSLPGGASPGARGAPQLVTRSLAVLCLFQIANAEATPPASMTPNPALHVWFDSLKQSGTQKPCCSISDCRFTDYKERDGHFEVIVDGWPYLVPDQAILRMTGNPTAHAVVCYGHASFGLPTPAGEVRTAPQDPIDILCFVPEKSVS
jgi:hypothetical protein